MLQIAKIATEALYEELMTYPKPGLVSHIDNGSHKDMNYDLFIQSINSLEPYFLELANFGAKDGHSFSDLRQIGIAAEKAMLTATNNINTHRGSIFILGILVAATSSYFNLSQKKSNNSLAQHIRGEDMNYIKATKISNHIITKYQTSLKKHPINPNSHGAKIRDLYHLESIIDSAANGFPLIFKHLIEFRNFKNLYSYNDAKVCIFLSIMSCLDDTNMVHRGGIEALTYGKNMAKEILKQKNINVIRKNTLELHKDFIHKNLSPGGVADILAAVIFIDKVEQLWP